MQFMQTNEYILSQTKGKKYLLYSKEPKTTNSAQNDISLKDISYLVISSNSRAGAYEEHN